jgi:hypothetical protein
MRFMIKPLLALLVLALAVFGGAYALLRYSRRRLAATDARINGMSAALRTAATNLAATGRTDPIVLDIKMRNGEVTFEVVGDDPVEPSTPAKPNVRRGQHVAECQTCTDSMHRMLDQVPPPVRAGVRRAVARSIGLDDLPPRSATARPSRPAGWSAGAGLLGGLDGYGFPSAFDPYMFDTGEVSRDFPGRAGG